MKGVNSNHLVSLTIIIKTNNFSMPLHLITSKNKDKENLIMKLKD